MYNSTRVGPAPASALPDISGGPGARAPRVPSAGCHPGRVKRSVSLVIEGPAGLLLVRRPDDDESLPGAWGLPAASLRPGESERDAAVSYTHLTLPTTPYV